MAEQRVPSDWNQQPLPELVVDTAGGVVSGVEPYLLQENQLAYLKNVSLDTLGLRTKRAGLYPLGGMGTEPHGIGKWVHDDQTRYLIGVWDTDVYLSEGDLSWTYAGSNVSLVPALYGMCHGDIIQASVGTSGLFLYGVEPWTGNTQPPLWVIPENGDATVQASYYPRAAAFWQGRLWIAAGNKLRWSNILDGWNIDPTNNLDIDPDQSDELMAIVPTRSSAPRLYLFKTNAVYALDVVWTGGVYVPSTENTLDTTNSRLHPISLNVGCVAPKTIVYSSGSGRSDVFFLASDGYRSLTRVEQDVAGGAGDPVSKPIQDIIDRVNWTYAHRAVAQVYDNKIYLSLPVDGDTKPNLTVVFDLTKKIWIGVYSYTPEDGVVFDLANQAPKHYLQWRYETTETLAGTNATSAAHIFEALRADTYYDPSNTAVEFQEDTRSLLFGDFSRKKRWNFLELMLQPAETNATITIYVKVDENDWETLTTVGVEPSYAYPVLPAPLPFNLDNAEPQREQIDLTGITPGYRLQVRCKCNSPSDFGLRTLRATAWPMQEMWE